MNSRDRLRESDFSSEVINQLEELLSSDVVLKSFRDRRREEALESKVKNNELLKDSLSNMIKSNPKISKLFGIGMGISREITGKKNIKNENDIPFECEEFPTYFRLKGQKDSAIFSKNVPRNKKIRIAFETDACNDFFSRESRMGSFELQHDSISLFNYSYTLHNGTLNLTITIPAKIAIGTVIEFLAFIKSHGEVKEFKVPFKIIVEKNEKTKPRKKSDKQNEEKDLKLPEIIEVTKNELGNHLMALDSAVKVTNAENSMYDFYINIDNIFEESNE